MRPLIIVQKIYEPISATATINDNVTQTPRVINATAVESHIDFIPELSGFTLENEGPKAAKIRVNGIAGLGDGQYSFSLPKNEGRGFTDVKVSRISVICAAGETAKIVIQPIEEAP